jgi:hypothetical protein
MVADPLPDTLPPSDPGREIAARIELRHTMLRDRQRWPLIGISPDPPVLTTPAT